LSSTDPAQESKFELQASELRLIAEIGRIASASPSLDSVFSAFADTAKKLIPFDRLAISTIDPTTGLISDAHISGQQIEGRNFTGPYSLEESSVPRPVWEDFVTRVLDESELTQNSGPSAIADSEHRISAGLTSAMFTPVVMQRGLVGVLVFRSKLENPYGPRERDLADQVSAQIAGAISMNQQFDQFEIEVATRKKLADEQARIAKIGRIVGSTLSLDETFLSLAEEVGELISFDRFVITEYSEDNLKLSRLFSHGIEIPDAPLGTGIRENHTTIFEHNIERQETLVLHGSEYEKFSEQSPSEKLRYESGLRALLAIPIIWQGNTIGSVFFRSFDEKAFGVHEIDLGEQVAQAIAGAVATNKQYSLIQEQSTEAQRLADVQARIAEIGRIVSSTLDLDAALSGFVEQVRSLLPFDRVVISTVNEELTEVVDVLVRGLGDEDSKLGIKLAFPEPDILRDSIARHEVFSVGGEEYPEYAKKVKLDQHPRFASLRSFMLVPLVWQGHPIGSLNLRSTDPHAYGEYEISIAKQVGAQIAGAIATSNQYSQLKAEYEVRQNLVEEQARIAEIGRIVSSTLDLNEVFKAFAEQVKQLIPFDRFVIAVVDEDITTGTDIFVDGAGSDRENFDKQWDIAANNVIKSSLINQSAYVEDGATYRERVELTSADPDSPYDGLQSFLLIPLLWQGRAIGSINFHSRSDSAYGEQEISLASQIGAQIAGAIATSSQFKALEEESSKRQRLANEQARIAEIGRIVSSTLDLNEVFKSFAKQARELIPFQRLVISLVNPDKSTTTDAYIDGIAAQHNSGENQHPIADDIKEPVVRSNKTLVANFDELPAEIKSSGGEQNNYAAGLRSVLLVPLAWQGEVVGTLNFRSVDRDVFGDHEVQLAEQIGAQIAGAVASSNQYQQLQEQANERERLAFEQSRLAEISRIVSSTLDFDEVLEALLEQARSLVPFDRFVITTVNEDLTEMRDILVDGIGAGAEKDSMIRKIGPDSQMKKSMTDLSIFHATGDYYQKPIGSSNPEIYRQFSESLLIPLTWQNKPIGTLNLYSVKPDAYTPAIIALAEQIAAQIAGAVATADQYQRLEQALSDSQIQQMAIEAADDAILIRDSEANLIYVNSAFERQTGFSASEVLGTNFIYPENRGQSTEKLDQLWETIRSGKSWRSVVPSQRKDGSEYIVDANLSPVFNADGEIDKFLGIRRDITAMFRTNESNRIQAAALEAAADAIVIRNADAKIEYVNAAFERQTGFTKSEVVGNDAKYLPTIKVSDPTYKKMWAHVRSGKTWNAVVSSTHKDGSEYVVDTSLSPIFNDGGEIDKFVGIRRDITARVKAEEANKFQAAALEAAADAVMILNPDTSIDWVNEAFVRDTGYSREEAFGQSSPFLRSDKNSDAIFDNLWSLVRAGQTWTGQIWTARKDGSEYLCEASLTPVFDDDGEISKFVGTRRDITERVQAEQDREARRDLDAQNQQLLELNKQREEFFSTVSHELRTPLTSVMAFADILSRDRHGTLTNLQKEHLDVIKRNGRNLNDLVEDMLDFSRLSTDQLKLNKSEFEIHSLLDSVVESLEPTAGLRNQKIIIEPNSEPVWVKADYSRIVQVVSNLITNSSKYSAASTQIDVKVEFESGHVSITVADTGIGIPPEDLTNIFSPFFRSEQITVRDEIGTGLGLAISKTLVDLHSGTIKAVSELEVGTRITVTLPGASTTPTVNARA